jgi:hypothetical protein
MKKFENFKKDWTFRELYNRLPDVIKNAMKSCQQDPKWHSEGDCEIHTEMVFDYAKEHYNDDELLLCAIFHDLGKPETTTIGTRPNGDIKISHIGHEVKSLKYIDRFFDLYSDVSTNKEKVYEICKNHIRAHVYETGQMSNKHKRSEFEKLKYFKEIMEFEKCDTNGKN